jgi:hypothetical protein
MATCTPQGLSQESTCFHCVPPDSKRVIEIYALNTLIGNLTARQLSAGAAQFRPITNKLALAAKVYLLTVLNGMVYTPAQLEALAKCWQCIPGSARLDVESYLYGVSAGSIDTQALSRLMAPYKSLYPLRDQVLLYQLSLLVGNQTVASIMAGAKCFSCLSTGRLEEIYLYLLCAGLAANIIPPGSRYNGSSEYDLAVLPNTYYQITWGSNDLYVIICGTTYYSLGVGSQIVVYTGACTLMQFFGTFANTTVSAWVKPVHVNPIPVPTGFTWTLSAGISTATWDPDPAGVFSVELWTSTDNVTFTLASTVVRPGTSTTVTGPASGTLYAKIRATSKVFPGYSLFTSVLSVVADPYEPVCGLTTFDSADYFNNSLSKGCGWTGAGVTSGAPAFSQFNYLNESNIWQLGGNNNWAWMRTSTVGTAWNRIRVGMMYTEDDTTSANIPALNIYVGMNHNAQSPFAAGGNFIGMQYGGGVAWSYTIDPSGNYIQPGAADRYAVKIVAGVSGVSSFGSNGVMQVRSTLHRTIVFVDIIKGSPNYTVRVYRESAIADTYRDYTFADFVTGMQAAENVNMTISGKTLTVFTTTLAFDETGGALDGVYALLTGSANAIGYISAIAVRKLA